MQWNQGKGNKMRFSCTVKAQMCRCFRRAHVVYIRKPSKACLLSLDFKNWEVNADDSLSVWHLCFRHYFNFWKFSNLQDSQKWFYDLSTISILSDRKRNWKRGETTNPRSYSKWLCCYWLTEAKPIKKRMTFQLEVHNLMTC